VTLPLAGVPVVVTRPSAQAAGFAARVKQAGGTPILFPAIEIEPVELDAGARARLAPDGFDWTVYTSANAVESSLRQLPRPARTRVAAIGRGTSRALAAHGIAVDAVPTTTAESEGLLALQSFLDVRGCRILILKGVGGRTLLHDELSRRGAAVTLGEVYRRVLATPAHAALAELQAASESGRAIIAATSTEVLSALLELAPAERIPRLRSATVLVPGERVAAAARTLGWRGPVIVGHGAEDSAMFEALVRAAAGPPAAT
jgi:uroporphyrinogen-III synthase